MSTEPKLSAEASIRSFLGWIIAGAGFHIGWAVIQLIIDLIAKALAK